MGEEKKELEDLRAFARTILFGSQTPIQDVEVDAELAERILRNLDGGLKKRCGISEVGLWSLR